MQNVAVTRKGRGGPVGARIFMLMARSAPTAVLFRRGPSKWTQILKWHTDTDIFEPGQWFHGRLYERRSDLSPDGTLLIYFAQKINGRTLNDREYTYAWTAVSRPPYLTALALWTKGDCWHGGGLFPSTDTVILNHREPSSKAHPNHPPKGVRVELKDHVQGEDDPLFGERLRRDGWRLTQEWQVHLQNGFVTSQPEVREKRQASGEHVIRLMRSIQGFDYLELFFVSARQGAPMVPMNNVNWADWDQRDRLVFARDGKVCRAELNTDGGLVEKELIDLNSFQPEQRRAPEWATHW